MVAVPWFSLGEAPAEAASLWQGGDDLLEVDLSGLADGERPHLVIHGIGRADLGEMPDGESPVRLHVVRDGAVSEQPVAGRARFLVLGQIRFEPVLPLVSGVTYRVLVPALERSFDFLVPAQEPGGERRELLRVQVVGVFPSGELLPENLLRFYIQFAGPMSRGDAYRYIELIGPDGEPVEASFLRLEEELWDANGTRLTLLFDPGRLKSGLVPRNELGLPLGAGDGGALAGGAFELRIDGAWPDAQGRPLVASYVHRFLTTPADRSGTHPDRWQLELPRAGTKHPLRVQFDEPLDYGMLWHAIRVVRADQASRDVVGEVEVKPGETGWSFTPDTAWTAGAYFLAVEKRLEDRAGNRVDRPFERESTSEPGAVASVDALPGKWVHLQFHLASE